jgi:hypothetical protein
MAEIEKKIETVVEVKTVETKVEVEYYELKLSKGELDLVTSVLGKCNGFVPENFYNTCADAGGESRHISDIPIIQLVGTPWNRKRNKV